jgi:hypothetical protein
VKEVAVTVRVVYHHEDEGWWAESDDVSGWTAVADTYEGLRAIVHESLAEFCGADVDVDELGAPVSFLSNAAEPLSGSSGLQVVGGGTQLVAHLSLNLVPAVRKPVPRVERAEVTSDDDALASHATSE